MLAQVHFSSFLSRKAKLLIEFAISPALARCRTFLLVMTATASYSHCPAVQAQDLVINSSQTLSSGTYNIVDVDTDPAENPPITVFFSGTTQASILNGRNTSTLNVTSGSVLGRFANSGSSVANITGGLFSGSLNAFDSGRFNLFGTGLALSSSTSGSDMFGSYNQYTLSGTLQSGQSVQGLIFRDYNGGFQVGNPANPNGSSSPINFFNAAPEPASFLLLLMGSPVYVIRRLQRKKIAAAS